jgi:hypothetical protein
MSAIVHILPDLPEPLIKIDSIIILYYIVLIYNKPPEASDMAG